MSLLSKKSSASLRDLLAWLMVHVYVFEVTAPFVIAGVDAWVNDVFVWRAARVVQIRKLGDQVLRWSHPPHVTVSLLRYEERLRCHDPNPPRLQTLARLTVGAGRAPRSPQESAYPPPLRIVK